MYVKLILYIIYQYWRFEQKKNENQRFEPKKFDSEDSNHQKLKKSLIRAKHVKAEIQTKKLKSEDSNQKMFKVNIPTYRLEHTNVKAKIRTKKNVKENIWTKKNWNQRFKPYHYRDFGNEPFPP